MVLGCGDAVCMTGAGYRCRPSVEHSISPSERRIICADDIREEPRIITQGQRRAQDQRRKRNACALTVGMASSRSPLRLMPINSSSCARMASTMVLPDGR